MAGHGSVMKGIKGESIRLSAGCCASFAFFEQTEFTDAAVCTETSAFLKVKPFSHNDKADKAQIPHNTNAEIISKCLPNLNAISDSKFRDLTGLDCVITQTCSN